MKGDSFAPLFLLQVFPRDTRAVAERSLAAPSACSTCSSPLSPSAHPVPHSMESLLMLGILHSLYMHAHCTDGDTEAQKL